MSRVLLSHCVGGVMVCVCVCVGGGGGGGGGIASFPGSRSWKGEESLVTWGGGGGGGG